MQIIIIILLIIIAINTPIPLEIEFEINPELKDIKPPNNINKKIKILNKLNIDQININIEYGTGEIKSTLISYTSFWAIISMLKNKKEYTKILNNTKIKLEPKFSEKTLQIQGNCIFDLKIANIINII